MLSLILLMFSNAAICNKHTFKIICCKSDFGNISYDIYYIYIYCYYVII